ncbi:MAG: 4Fe-4S dicluster domain-containing protein [Chloroflexi bacterium]|nr:4Fe-4S dicluster domain-containing protein [Chloroflexota bacterium]
MPVGMLIDTTMCIGCRGCQAACKRWNMLPTRNSQIAFSPDMTNPPKLNANNYNILRFFELENSNNELSWHFVHKRCFHCYSPVCVSVCPVGALNKLENGAVIWDESQCFACRYCQNACPFQIPKFQYDSNWGKIEKCNFCWNRIGSKEAGNDLNMQPACATTCPVGAIKFGQRADLIEEAYDRIRHNPERYVSYVYGEHEVGGTAVVYLMSVDYEKLGFPTVGKEMYPQWTHEFLARIPVEVAAIICLLLAIWYWRKTRIEKKAEESAAINTATLQDKEETDSKKSKGEEK